jgi:hypothetical protein
MEGSHGEGDGGGDGTFSFFFALLFEEVGIKPEPASRHYAGGLVEQGACLEDLLEASTQSLQVGGLILFALP